MLTRPQFDAACKALVDKHARSTATSVATYPLRGWCWHEHSRYPNLGYLSRIVNVFRRTGAVAVGSDNPLDDVVCEEVDPSTAAIALEPDQVLVCQQHVVFSATFRVPTFYFTVHSASGAPLPLGEVLHSTLFKVGSTDDLEVTSYAASLPKSAFPVLSHGDHPTLNVPCWYFHPCETASVIDELVREVREDGWDEEARLVRWLELWFMVVSSVVNL